MSEDFDPSKSCPVTKNAWCSEDDCPFYNTELSQCSLWRRTAPYYELAGAISGAQNDQELDLGQIFKDVTVWVDKACTLQLGAVGQANINMTVASGRVGTPLVITDIWIQKVYITTTETTNYIVTGNG
jgi:hypothetical protein